MSDEDQKPVEAGVEGQMESASAAKIASAKESLELVHDALVEHVAGGSAIPAHVMREKVGDKSIFEHLRHAMKQIGEVAKDIGIGAAEVAGEIVVGGAVEDN